MSINISQNLLTTTEAAKVLNLAEITLRMWRVNGTGPRFIKMGKSIRYAVEDINIFCDEHKTVVNG